MKVEMDKKFPVAGSASAAWRFLQDMESVAECLPGARITERVDDTHYKGQVKMKVGPATAIFEGEIEVLGVDEGKRELHFLGKGRDTRGSSNASMDLTASVEETADGNSELRGISEVAVTGKLASLGGRLMNQVADHVLKQFAEQFSSRVAALDEPEDAPAVESPAPPAAESLNGLALLWSVVAGLFRGLFRGGGGFGRA